MEATADEPKQGAEVASTGNGSAPENADVEMKPATDEAVSVKDEESAPLMAVPAADEADKKPPPKRKKKKKPKQASPNVSKKPKKDPNKPEYPKVGYVRFMYVRREELRVEFPDMHHLDVTKKIGEEWTALSDEQKKPYLDAAVDDKIRYKMEMKEYNKNLAQKSGDTKKPLAKRKKKPKKPDTDTDTELEPSPKKTKRRGPITSDQPPPPPPPPPDAEPSSAAAGAALAPATPSGSQLPAMPTLTSLTTPPPSPPQTLLQMFGDIPIFTGQFLEHNRQMETELKKIRKMNTDIDQQNSVLEKYAESVQLGIDKLHGEIDEVNGDNERLTAYLHELRAKLAAQLQHLAIPSEPDGATIDNVDKFMDDLYGMAQTNEHGPASLNKAKDLLRKVDLNIEVKSLPKAAAVAPLVAAGGTAT